MQPKAKRTVGMTNVGQVSHTDANRRQESSSPNDATWNNREPLETENLCSPLCLISHGGALCFSIGDHAGINCQTCLTPPCHLIIACNTPECWQCWAIDSWHSLKLLIIFSHKPLSDLSTSLYCLWRKKSSVLTFQDYALRGNLQLQLWVLLNVCALRQPRQM